MRMYSQTRTSVAEMRTGRRKGEGPQREVDHGRQHRDVLTRNGEDVRDNADANGKCTTV
jgi:hypothetical protein